MEIMAEGWCRKHLVAIKQIIIGNRGKNKMAHYFKINFLVIVILLATSSSGGADLMNLNILSRSKVKESSFKQILNDIKKTLPKELRQCAILVTDIRLLKRENNNVAENWTVEVCQDKREYFVSTYHPKGYFCTVTPKEKVFAFEKVFWNTAKKDGTEEKNKMQFFYIDELEGMEQK